MAAWHSTLDLLEDDLDQEINQIVLRLGDRTADAAKLFVDAL
jgi:hypothetical protein